MSPAIDNLRGPGAAVAQCAAPEAGSHVIPAGSAPSKLFRGMVYANGSENNPQPMRTLPSQPQTAWAQPPPLPFVQMGETPQPVEAYSRCSQPASAIPPPPPEPPERPPLEPPEPPPPPVPVPSLNGDPPQEIARTNPRTPTAKRIEIFVAATIARRRPVRNPQYWRGLPAVDHDSVSWPGGRPAPTRPTRQRDAGKSDPHQLRAAVRRAGGAAATSTAGGDRAARPAPRRPGDGSASAAT